MALEPLGIPSEQERAIAGAMLIGSLWGYAASVFYPSLPLKQAGVYRPRHVGERPSLPRAQGLGPRYSREHPFPVLLEQRPPRYELVDEFDHVAGEYEAYVEPFSAPVIKEAVTVMRPYLTPSTRLIDTSCGAGTEATLLATLVPEGEVVAADFAAAMVQTTFTRARSLGIGNMAFLQADVAHLPDQFGENFDATFCSLAFHHYPDPIAATRELYRVLRPGGHAFVVDAGPAWFKLMSSWLAAWADPGWISFYTEDEFQDLFLGAGFAQFHWEELLPGLGLVIAMK
jgi:ubiquinone/menaquinone biosynthesis C-methylase UbiE